MTAEELKQELDGLLGKKRLARSLQRQIQRKREEIDCLPAVSLDGTRVQGGKSVPAAEKFVDT